GTTFMVFLPTSVAETSRANLDRAEAFGSRTEESLRGSETILLVDDESVVRCMMRDTLELFGYKVIEAARGTEALQALSRYDRQIHLLLTDLSMPEMDGFELTTHVRSLRPSIRTLIVTGCSDESTQLEQVLANGVPVLAKPFSTDDLMHWVREILDGTFTY
ncbi:MAG: response regulator, partial [Bdellovibrionales bacterium]|nr:response regulator [Bdellovibrionales bacterium]